MGKTPEIEILKDTPVPIEHDKSQEGTQPSEKSQVQSSFKAEFAIETRIEQLRSSIEDARFAFKRASRKLFYQVLFWGFISSVIIVFAFCFSVYLLSPENVKLPDKWTWQVIYYTLIRMTIIGAIFSFATYCFKLLSSHIQMYQYNEHKVAIIDALPGFVESGIDPQQRDLIFKKLIEMVVHFEETGIILKDKELKVNNDTLLKFIELVLKKDKEK